jgi:hypothetical protein
MMKMLALASKDRVSGPGDGTMISVRTTYPLCGQVRCGASKCGTKLVGGLSIGAGGGGTNLTFLETQGRLHNSRATSCGRMRPRSEKAEWCRGS